MKSNKLKKIKLKFCPFLGAGIMFYGIANTAKIHSGYQKGRSEYQKAQEYYLMPVSEEENKNGMERIDAAALPADAPETSKVDWDELMKVNEDIIAWIQIPALELSYPILQGEDNDYYLHHDMHKEELFAGSIFLDAENDPDFLNYNSIIYGHNMRDGSMFAKLKDLQNKEVLKSCPYFWILTPKRNMLYQIFSVHTAVTGSETYTIQFGSAEKYAKWVENMTAQSVYSLKKYRQTGKIVTLSTCAGNHSMRQIVQGMQIL